jgi:tetratricopeptide (TPR) repeat protein
MAVPRLAPLLACAILVLAHGAVFADSLEEIFERGNRAYDDERFDEAAESYRTLLEYQIEDPRVEYNLGNTEFRRGNLGQAILHYERAKRLDPTDPDILDNLRFARSHRLDRVPEPERPAAFEWLVGLQDRLGPDRLAWLAVAVLWLVCASVAFGLSRAGRWNAGYGWLLAALVLVIVLLGASWYATYERLEGRSTAVVVQRVVEVLAGPGKNNATLATVHEGLAVEIWGQRSEWIQVRMPNGVSGWVPKGAVEVV